MNHLQGFGLFFLIGGAVGACGGIERVFRKRALVRRAAAVDARVVAVESEGGDEPGDVTWHFPVVAFTADGKSQRVRLPRGTARRDDFRVGRTLRVYYDPRDPTRAAARPRDFPGGWLATTLGAVFVAVGAGLCWAGWSGGR